MGNRISQALGRFLVRMFPSAEQIIAERTGLRTSSWSVTKEGARRHSAVWACQRLRADLVSTMPIDAYRKVGGLQIEIPKPPMLVNPGGERVDILEWMYSSQIDLDGYGNTFGIITAKNALGLPACIELQPVESVSVKVKGGVLDHYTIGGKRYEIDQVWHEKQFTSSGIPVGLSPIMHSARAILAGLSAQEFAAAWFQSGGIPSAHLKNTEKTLKAAEAELVKARFKASVANHEPFVSGMDWTYDMVSVPANQAQFIEMMDASVIEIARFLGCPGDLIDAAVSGQSITYANISQRNLQFLIINLGPALIRRETAMSRWLPRPQFVKLNSDAMLRMDPKTRAELIDMKIKNRTMTNSAARALDNLAPLTPEEIAEFTTIYGPPKAAAVSAPPPQDARGLFEPVNPYSAVPYYDVSLSTSVCGSE